MTPYQRIVLASRPKGAPTLDNFRLQTADLPAPEDGELLVRTVWMSLDPYMRGRMDDAKSYAAPVEIGGTMEGGCVAEVVTSNASGFAPGDIVVGRVGWASHGVLKAKEVLKVDASIAPISTALGVLGMPGHTAFVGLNDILQGQAGETIVVSAATGAVGSLVGQLAKRKGMRTIGVAGGAEKCAYAVENLGYDACLDHHDPDLAGELAALTPQGVDCYYENVGGKTLEAVLPRLNIHGRIAVCGMIAWYSGKGVAEAMRLPAFLAEVAPLVASGEIHYRESVAEGLENAPAAFLQLLEGGNFGKQLVRVGPDP